MEADTKIRKIKAFRKAWVSKPTVIKYLKEVKEDFELRRDNWNDAIEIKQKKINELEFEKLKLSRVIATYEMKIKDLALDYCKLRYGIPLR